MRARQGQPSAAAARLLREAVKDKELPTHAVRLLLTYALRKGALKALQFKHFDHNRR